MIKTIRKFLCTLMYRRFLEKQAWLNFEEYFK